MIAREFRAGVAFALALVLVLQPMAGVRAQAASARSQFSNTTIFKPGALSDSICLETFLWAAQARPEEAQVWLGNVRFLGRKLLAGKTADERGRLEADIQNGARDIAAKIVATSSEADRYSNDLRACSRRLEDAEGAVPQAEPGTAERLFAKAEALGADGKPLSIADKESALADFHAACRLGLAQACIRYAQTQGMRTFFGAADAIREEGFALGRACELGDGDGCIKLGKHHDPTDLFASAKDFPAAIAAYRRACDAHSLVQACAKASDLLRSDRNPNPNPVEANAYQRKAQELRGIKIR